MLFHYPVWAGKHWRFFSKPLMKKVQKTCHVNISQPDKINTVLHSRWSYRIPESDYSSAYLWQKYRAVATWWCRVAAAGGDISGDNLQNVRSNRDLLLQSPEVTLTTGRPPPSWQLCHYMAYHQAIPKYEHKTIISSYYVGKLQRLLMLAYFNNIIHRTIYWCKRDATDEKSALTFCHNLPQHWWLGWW